MGLFDQYFIGKADQPAFGDHLLPATRPQLFKRMWREHAWRLIPLNLLCVVFRIPLFLLCGVALLRLYAVVTAGTEETITQVLAIAHRLALGLLPCIALTGPGDAALAGVTRNWARDQRAEVFSDFWRQFAQNWKQALCVSALTGVLPLVFYWYAAFVFSNPKQAGVAAIAEIVCIIMAAGWLLVRKTIYSVMVSYHLPLRHVVRNAVFMSLSKPLLTLGIYLLAAIPGAVGAVVLLAFSARGGALYFLVYGLLYAFAFDGFLKAAYANCLCETYMNSKIEGAGTRIGLRPEP